MQSFEILRIFIFVEAIIPFRFLEQNQSIYTAPKTFNLPLIVLIQGFKQHDFRFLSHFQTSAKFRVFSHINRLIQIQQVCIVNFWSRYQMVNKIIFFWNLHFRINLIVILKTCFDNGMHFVILRIKRENLAQIYWYGLIYLIVNELNYVFDLERIGALVTKFL